MGCGTGPVTAMLKERWPEAQVTGVDSSQAMLDRARTLEADIYWLERDLNEWEPEAPAELLYSNAALAGQPRNASTSPSVGVETRRCVGGAGASQLWRP